MVGPAVLRKRNRNFVLDLKPNHSKFDELKNPFVKLKSLSFLSNSKSNLSWATDLRKTTSDSYLLNWKVKKKELRKIEKQFVEIKMKNEEENPNYTSTVFKLKINDIAKRKPDFESTFLTTFPMQFGSLFKIKNFTFPDNSLFDNLGTFFSNNNIQEKKEHEAHNFDKGVNTSLSRFCKEIQTEYSKVNVKTQNVRVKKKSKRIQTDFADDNKALQECVGTERKAVNLNCKSAANEHLKKRSKATESKTNPRVNFSPGLAKQNSAKLADKDHLNSNIFNFPKYSNLMDACGFEIFGNMFSKTEFHQRDKMKITPPKDSISGLYKNVSKNACKTIDSNFTKNPIKLSSGLINSTGNKIHAAQKKLQCNTATMDHVCSVESKKSIDLIALRNFILSFSPLAQKSSVEMKEINNSVTSQNQKMKSHTTKPKIKTQNTDSKPTRQTKRRVKKRQSFDKNIGTDFDEITNLLRPRKNEKVNFKLENESPPKRNFDFKPIEFNHTEIQEFHVSQCDFPNRRFKKSATFRNGLIQKTCRHQTPPAKFVGRRGNIFDYVSCITSTSSTIYSSSESIRKIFARSKMSILTVESDYNSLLKILNTSNDKNMINCEVLKEDSKDTAEDVRLEEVIRVEDFRQEVIVAHMQTVQIEPYAVIEEVQEEKENSKLSFEISAEETVIAVGKYSDSDSFDVDERESKTRKCKQFGHKILRTINKLSHLKKSTNVSDAKLLKKSSDKLYKKKYKEILKEHKIREEFVALKKVSSSKMLKQYIFNIGQLEGVTASPFVINLRVDSLELSAKSSNKSSNKLKNIFNCVASNSLNNNPVEKNINFNQDANKVQYKKYSDEIIAKEEQRSVAQPAEEIASHKEKNEVTSTLRTARNSKLDDIMTKSLEDIRILFRSAFSSSDTEVSEHEFGGGHTHKIVVEKKLSSTDIKSPQRLVELKINPSNSDGEKCFANPISIYVDPNTQAVGVNGIYKIDCLEAIVVNSKFDTICPNQDLKSPMKVQVNLLLYQL